MQREDRTMWAKVVFVTGAKNKMRLEKNSNRRAFRDQKARHPELEKRLCDYVNDKRQWGCEVSSEMCQFKALAWIIFIHGSSYNQGTMHHGFRSYTASVSSSCRQAGADLASNGEWRGVATANDAQPPAHCAGFYLHETHCSYNVRADDAFFKANLYFS